MQRVVQRDTEALELLYDQFAGRVFAQVSRWLGSDVLAVEEAVEETFWQLWRQAPRLLDAEMGLQQGLLQLARSAADEAARRRSPAAPRPAAQDVPTFDQPFSGRLA
jgi:RNA polymerase sigma-70 factor (ECF subfamily)